MRRIRLWHFSLGLLLAAAGMIGYLATQGQLDWAWNALNLYRDGQTTSPVEHLLEQQALAILQRGGSPTEARGLLERSLAIDPNSNAVHKLGEAYLREGNLEAARAQYERYLTLDASFLPSYLRLLEVYEALGLPAERDRVLRSGIDHFAAQVEAYTPRPDDDVYSIYNDKARGVYNAYRESLHVLEQRARRSDSPADPAGL